MPARGLYVLVQTKPIFAVLATADRLERLEIERQALLDLAWGADEDARELRIAFTNHLPPVA